MKEQAVRFSVEWDGHRWVAELEGGGVTQAKNLDRLRANCVEVVALMLDRDVIVDDIDFDIVVDVPGIERDVSELIRDLRDELEALAEQLSDTTAATVKALASQGFPMRDISEVVGLSHQRVGQILADLRQGGVVRGPAGGSGRGRERRGS